MNFWLRKIWISRDKGGFARVNAWTRRPNYCTSDACFSASADNTLIPDLSGMGPWFYKELIGKYISKGSCKSYKITLKEKL